jgi:energy-coupling factor transporter ATP-binding protein EcfA2
MQIRQIRLSNFKLFREASVDARPLTLLTGANSSGKSAVLSAIAGAMQTVAPYAFPFEFVPNGKNCTLGTYTDIVTGGSSRRNFGLGLSIDHKRSHVCLNVEYRFAPRGEHILPASFTYAVGENTLKVQWRGSERGYEAQLQAPTFVKQAKDSKYRAFLTSVAAFVKSKEMDVREMEAEFDREFMAAAADVEKWRPLGNTAPRQLASKLERLPAGSYLINNLQGFVAEMHRYIGYVGPIRATPLRYYPPDQPRYELDPSGDNTARLLDEWCKHDHPRFKKVVDLLHQLELCDAVAPESTQGDILRLLVKPHSHAESSNLADVGFGVSQALPFVVADVALPDEGVLLINQPEVHLHPASQAKLANLFAGRLEKRQYLVETHSEYLINRLRVVAMKGDLDPTQVIIWFLETADEEGPRLHEIELQKDGSLKGAPEQFFRTYYVDSFDLALGGER